MICDRICVSQNTPVLVHVRIKQSACQSFAKKTIDYHFIQFDLAISKLRDQRATENIRLSAYLSVPAYISSPN